VRELKEILAANFVDYKGCVEKNELIEKVRRLYRDRQNEKVKGKTFAFVDQQQTSLTSF
jgi:E3 ubiquitin-protein ligase RNF34